MFYGEDLIKLEKVRELAKAEMPKLTYHNFAHACDVALNIQFITYTERRPYKERFIGTVLGYTHDIRVVPGTTDNEEKSIEFVEPYLREFGFQGDEIAMNAIGTMATKIPTNPQTPLEMAVCDGDIWNIGDSGFWKTTDLVRREYGITDLQKWYTQVAGFLDKQRFYTDTGRTFQQPGLNKNKKLIAKLLADFDKERGRSQAEIVDLHLSRYGLREAA